LLAPDVIEILITIYAMPCSHSVVPKNIHTSPQRKLEILEGGERGGGVKNSGNSKGKDL